jgi:hypothetical protein
MNSKVKHDPTRYLTRAKIAGSAAIVKPSIRTPSQLAEQERRNAEASLDKLWYIQLPNRHRTR